MATPFLLEEEKSFPRESRSAQGWLNCWARIGEQKYMLQTAGVL